MYGGMMGISLKSLMIIAGLTKCAICYEEPIGPLDMYNIKEMEWTIGPWHSVMPYALDMDGESRLYPCSDTGVLKFSPPANNLIKSVVIVIKVRNARDYVAHISHVPEAYGWGEALLNQDHMFAEGAPQIQIADGKIRIYRAVHGHGPARQIKDIQKWRELLKADIKKSSYNITLHIANLYLMVSIDGQELYKGCDCGLMWFPHPVYIGTNRSLHNVTGGTYQAFHDITLHQGAGVCRVEDYWQFWTPDCTHLQCDWTRD